MGCIPTSGLAMRRREFIKAIVGTAAAWPLSARAQQLTPMRRVGVLLALTENDPLQNARLKAFRLGMRDLEWIEGRNVHIEYRFAGANLASINQHVAELIRLAPDAMSQIAPRSWPRFERRQALFQSYL
jgi:putative ABC transport system substrate-binding protein